VNINIGVRGDPRTVRSRVQNAHTTVFVPRGVNASVVGFTNKYFPETAQIIPVDWLNYVAGSRIEMVVLVSFKMAPGSPVMDAKVDVTRKGHRHIGGEGNTRFGVGVLQFKFTD
jgi:hypothetical protein